MTRRNAVRLTFAIGGLAVWCLALLSVPQVARADDPTLAALNQQLFDIAGTGDPNSRLVPVSSSAPPALNRPAAKGGKSFRPFPGLVDRFNKYERYMHFRSANGNFDANLWGAFAGGRGMAIKYHITR